jgi:hypothetical protein
MLHLGRRCLLHPGGRRQPQLPRPACSLLTRAGTRQPAWSLCAARSEALQHFDGATWPLKPASSGLSPACPDVAQAYAPRTLPACQSLVSRLIHVVARALRLLLGAALCCLASALLRPASAYASPASQPTTAHQTYTAAGPGPSSLAATQSTSRVRQPARQVSLQAPLHDLAAAPTAQALAAERFLQDTGPQSAATATAPTSTTQASSPDAPSSSQLPGAAAGSSTGPAPDSGATSLAALFEKHRGSVVNISPVRAMQAFTSLDLNRVPIGQVRPRGQRPAAHTPRRTSVPGQIGRGCVGSCAAAVGWVWAGVPARALAVARPQGSGLVWNDRGYVVTCYHIVRGAAEVKVGWGGPGRPLSPTPACMPHAHAITAAPCLGAAS